MQEQHIRAYQIYQPFRVNHHSVLHPLLWSFSWTPNTLKLCFDLLSEKRLTKDAPHPSCSHSCILFLFPCLKRPGGNQHDIRLPNWMPSICKNLRSSIRSRDAGSLIGFTYRGAWRSWWRNLGRTHGTWRVLHRSRALVNKFPMLSCIVQLQIHNH